MLGWLQSLTAWRVVRDTGIHQYQENTVTGRRRIMGDCVGGYQPVDRGWVETGEWTPRPPPPTVDSGARRPA